MARTIAALAFVGLINAVQSGEADDYALTLTFIGNEAVAISDGQRTLVSDFPYRSGYSTYMSYDPAWLGPDSGITGGITGDVTALITHRHPDHFEAALFAKTDWMVIGPGEVTANVAPDRVIPLADRIEHRGISITPIATPHANTQHFSYLVEWHGRSFYFAGDTESADALYALDREVDVAFLTPWVLTPLLLEKRDIPAKQVIVYHHYAGEEVPGCAKCLTPAQGQVVTLK